METPFGALPPPQAGTLAVQVIALVRSPASADSAPLRDTLAAMLAAPVARRVLAIDGPAADRLASAGLRVALAPRLEIGGVLAAGAR